MQTFLTPLAPMPQSRVAINGINGMNGVNGLSGVSGISDIRNIGGISSVSGLNGVGMGQLQAASSRSGSNAGSRAGSRASQSHPGTISFTNTTSMGMAMGTTGATPSSASEFFASSSATTSSSSSSTSTRPAHGHSRPLSPLSPLDAVKSSITHLLTRAYSLPCSTAAQAYSHLVQPTARFQLALDALLPLLDDCAVEDGPTGNVWDKEGAQLAKLPQRILVAYILFSMYAPYPITVNPFKSVLLVSFVRERNRAVHVANEGGVSTNEQLVWVLWKILKGDGNDIGPYTPSTLARSPLPPKLRASNLNLDDALYNSMFDIDDNVYSYFQLYNNQRVPSASSDPVYNKNEQPQILQTPQSHTPSLRTVPPAIRTVEDERQNEKVVHGMQLLLAARERVLTLAEQRTLIPIIPDLAASQMVASLDMAPLGALNPQITHLLIVSIFNNTTKTANVELLYPYLETLSCLPPTRPSFDLMGRLIQDTSPISLTGYSTVADLIRMEVLGRFIHECITWLERAEVEEREGLVSDDRYAQGVQNLCRFYTSLVKLSIIDPTSDVDSAEMAHFSLRHARFEEANVLYRTLAVARL